MIIVATSNTWLGRSYYALGGNRIAAARLQISEAKLWIIAYVLSGIMAALTGIVLLGFSGGGFIGVGGS